MEKLEYKSMIDKIRSLTEEGKKEEAMDLLDNMNWRKIHNVNALMQAADLYERLDRKEDAKDLLLVAHDRSPIGRMVIYRLALICIKMEEYDEAQEFYDEFVEIAPHDSMKYVIRYHLNKARGADDQTIIGILEELKDHDFLEDWAFELALLYQKVGETEKCVDLCDEIILWYGDGPYVEKALELKMLYSPLDKEQEDKYRRFQKRHQDEVKEISVKKEAEEAAEDDIVIPEIIIPNTKFNTINLQAEIKKNIEEIMRATAANEVSENMQNIKALTEDIPYLQVTGDTREMQVRKKEEDRIQIDTSLKDEFHEYLAEENDGQISMYVPDEPEHEQQVEGQMSIEDVMNEWEKTRRAAAAALESAEQKKLESQKAQALAEANEIMDRLTGVIPKLEAGVAPEDLLKEEYLNNASNKLHEMVGAAAGDVNAVDYEQASHIMAGVNDMLQKEIDRLNNEINEPQEPVEEVKPEINLDETQEISLGEFEALVQNRKTEEPVAEVEEIAAEVEEAVEEPAAEVEEPAAEIEEAVEEPAAEIEEAVEESAAEVEEAVEESAAEVEEAVEEPAAEIEEAAEEIEATEEETVEETEEIVTEEVQAEVETEESGDMNLADEDGTFAEEEEKVYVEADDDAWTETPEQLAAEQEAAEQEEEHLDALEAAFRQQATRATWTTQNMESDPIAAMSAENVFSRDAYAPDPFGVNVAPAKALTKEQKKVFEAFTPIDGMESQVSRALEGVRKHLQEKEQGGQLIISGNAGSGKTTLAMGLIQVLQKEIKLPKGAVGKIDAEKLNTKDIIKLFDKIRGGVLIIEGAGELTRVSAATLNALLDTDTTGVLVVLEDTRANLAKVLELNKAFTSKFTNRIDVPIFTIDELVNFGRGYALENGCSVDEMGILAMYNRINLIQRLGHPTSLADVREIVDAAMNSAKVSGIRKALSKLGTKKYDEKGNLLLHEKDFDQD